MEIYTVDDYCHAQTSEFTVWLLVKINNTSGHQNSTI